MRARYKECSECHELGHSCIPKEKPKRTRRKYATDEERKAAQKEYQRRYRERHREKKRESNRASYWRKKGEEPPEEKKKRGRKPKLTPEERKARRLDSSKRWAEAHKDHIREYQRMRYHQKKQQEAASTERFYCSMCKHIKPADDFITDDKQFKVCNDCREKARAKKATQTKAGTKQRKPKSQHGTSPRVEYHRQYWQEHREEIKAARVEQAINRERKAKKKEPEDKMCWKCWKWPCFEGIESFETDFAKEGCRSFHLKEDAS